MRSPLRTEADAFRFLGIVIVGAALIVGAASVNTWLGVAVAAVVVGAISWWYWRSRSRRAPVRMLDMSTKGTGSS
jgi:membrane protein implicated in regulation of membrane protease activity